MKVQVSDDKILVTSSPGWKTSARAPTPADSAIVKILGLTRSTDVFFFFPDGKIYQFNDGLAQARSLLTIWPIPGRNFNRWFRRSINTNPNFHPVTAVPSLTFQLYPTGP